MAKAYDSRGRNARQLSVPRPAFTAAAATGSASRCRTTRARAVTRVYSAACSSPRSSSIWRRWRGGVWRSRPVQTGDDFLVAGRSLPARVLVFTLLSTWIGSGSLFAGAGLGYRAGSRRCGSRPARGSGSRCCYFLAPRVRRPRAVHRRRHPRAALRPGGRRARDDHHRPRLHHDRRLSVPRRRPAAEPRRRHRSGRRRADHRRCSASPTRRSPACCRSPTSTSSTA